MFLKEKDTGELVSIADLEELFNPLHPMVEGRGQSGEEEQDLAEFDKNQLVFPSGEALPRCWVNAAYRQQARPTVGGTRR